MSSPDPYGRAIRDHYLGVREEPLIDRDGATTREHRIEHWYFGEHAAGAWRDQFLDGPLLDMGAGAGRDALYYQTQFETVAIDVSEHLVQTMDDRGVEQAIQADMFDLTTTFPPDRFQSAHAIGTQVGLAGSMAGVRRFFEDLAVVTTDDATAVVDNYIPGPEAIDSVFAYRDDAAPGLGYRVYHEVYEGEVGRTLVFRIFSVDRLPTAVAATPWSVTDVSYGETQWRAVLQKASA